MLFIGLLSSAILFLLMSFLFLFFYFGTKKECKRTEEIRVKNKKKKKKLRIKIRKLQKKQRSQLYRVCVFLLLMFLTAGGALYARYYQLSNLTVEDAAVVANGYYLVGEVEKQLNSLEKGASAEKTIKNIKSISSQLTSSSAQTPSRGMSVEGQKLLNRHFTLMKNLGINLYGQSQEALKKPATVGEYLNDIKKIHASEQTVFKEFKINESALKQKK